MMGNMKPRSKAGVLISIVLAIPCLAQQFPPRPTPRRPVTPPPRPAFIIGAFQQPVSSFDTWRTRGINTLVGYEAEKSSKNISNHDWTESAAAKGFYYIKQPSDNPQADAADPNLLAWMHADEPDVKKPPTDPEILQQQYNDWKKVAPNLPIFINFSGGNVLGGKISKETYHSYIQSADWIGNDFYPVTGYNRPDWLWKVGAAIDQLRDWSHDKPQFALIECSAQRLSWTPKSTRGVTADELRAEIWHAVIHGVKGIIYFPQQFGGGFRYDAVQEKVSLEMALQNKHLTELAAILASPMNPHIDQKPRANSPIEIGWRISENKLYIIALNFSDDLARAQIIHLGVQPTQAKSLWETQSPDLKNQEITDDFQPYQVRIYQLDLKK
jgi:hypothetical protein